jgi:murein DD-endopeptidase MepM/ murein hydrolase activator NlpD
MDPRHLNIVIVDRGAARILRMNLSYAALSATVVGLLVVLSGLALILLDYGHLRTRAAEVSVFHRDLDEHRRVSALIKRRVADIRGEVGGWRTVHTNIWQPLGPEQRGSVERGGIGGGDTPDRAAAQPGGAVTAELDEVLTAVKEEGQRLQALERFMSRAGPVLAAVPSRWPLRGHVNSEFGRRRSPWSGDAEFHDGLDIGADSGSPVKAPAPGTVIFAGVRGNYGRTVILDHGGEVRTLFGHLEQIEVAPGQRVERGQRIAQSGNTGRSTGPHLHYEILVQGRPMNPRTFLWD